MAGTSTGAKDVNTWLATKQAQADKELATEWAALEELHNKKLWHQLTLKLRNFVTNPALQKGNELIELYTNFIQGFENKINPLALVEIIAFIVPKYTDPKEAVTFLEATEPKVKQNSEAVSLCKVLQGQIYLEKLNDQVATKKIIEDVEKILDDADGVTSVHGRYYLLASQYYRLQGKHAEYYRTALSTAITFSKSLNQKALLMSRVLDRYLGCVELTELSNSDQVQHAFFLGLAALLGEGVYNLGELLAHPILNTLKTTSNAWLVELLFAFNTGDIAKFEKMKLQWETVPDLAAQEIKLRQKISLLCLMEMTFKRPANDRELTFAEIARETRLPVKEVELLVMKALAQGLVRGAIDQVSSSVHMTWVQPRVLDTTQLSSMVSRLNFWCRDVKKMEMLLEDKGHDFLTL